MARWCRSWLAWVLVVMAMDVVATSDVQARLKHALQAEKKLMNKPKPGPYATHLDDRKAGL